MLNSLSGRFLILTTVFVMLAEVLIFVPSVARFREDYLLARLERAQIASLALEADNMISPELEAELLLNAEVYNVVLRRDEMRQLALSSPIPAPINATYDMRDPTAMTLIVDALTTLVDRDERIARVIGNPVRDGGLLIEVTMDEMPLRAAMIDYGLNVLALSAVISVITAFLLFLAVQGLLVRPIKRVVGHMQSYAKSPEDARRIITPSARVTELRDAEMALQSMQVELTGALKQKERLAQLGGAVAKVSHDLRNILTSAQLFTDRIEGSDDPLVKRMAPKLVGSITRAVNLCETTLAFGRVDEPAPALTRVNLARIVSDVFDSERLAAGDDDISFAEDIPVGMTLRADGEQLYRAIFNLVRNARQAITATGKAGEISIKGFEDDNAWWIVVSDTGPGLPPKAKEFLFQPFQGGARKGGSGLGLVIAADLVRGHGGRLDLASTGVDGTVFKIQLPKADFALAAAID
ncbi:MAG: HAMP domain-containing histidine kinase [Loktanella sp.]|jgi:signal transduction histidine kinase|nr:HAMP domain-containing histidine kinase [Loktanella sp.]MDO7608573.1 HAMP domain-containing histidine kinase [Loktanella sp.]MDO7624521.1 HAMP domain-containing histidine kinase [Loktanella sp.]MDO7627578.1 HAMP domain-containing histidine kinase [Loktanella sp.]MDO7666111.1 HAMP domain-containing histidine kinase [Loktanella sp.]